MLYLAVWDAEYKLNGNIAVPLNVSYGVKSSGT